MTQPQQAPLPRIHYRVVGQDDYMLTIDVDGSGAYVIDSGDYTSHEPRAGRLDDAGRARIAGLITALIAAVGGAWDYPAPDGADGFTAELTIGDGPDVRHYRFWEGGLDVEPTLAALIRALEVIDA